MIWEVSLKEKMFLPYALMFKDTDTGVMSMIYMIAQLSLFWSHPNRMSCFNTFRNWGLNQTWQERWKTPELELLQILKCEFAAPGSYFDDCKGFLGEDHI